MPLERSVFVDNAGDARGGIGTDDGGVFVSSDEESLFVVVIVAHPDYTQGEYAAVNNQRTENSGEDPL